MLISGDVQAFICRDAVDMRKSIDGLSYLVEPLLAKNPLSGHLFVFVGRDRSKVKILYWDRTGFALWYKRLSHGRFPSPATLAQRGFTLAELNAWLEGCLRSVDPATAARCRESAVRCAKLTRISGG